VAIVKSEQSRAGNMGWSARWAAGLASAGLGVTLLTANGCSSGFSSCEASRTCPPPVREEPGGDAGGAGEGGSSGGAAGGSLGGGSLGGEGGWSEAGGAPARCLEPRILCGDRCVDPLSSAEHCGDCETSCGVGSICSDGTCTACPPSNIGCDGVCINPAADARFCGASGSCSPGSRGTACAETQVCKEAACVSDEARLGSLTLQPATLTPAFSPDVQQYRATFAYFEPHLTVQAAPLAADTSMSCAGQLLTPADSLPMPVAHEDEPLAIDVEVTAASGRTLTYEVALERSALVTNYVKAFNSRAAFRFGTSVALDGDTLVVGAPGEDSGASGVDGNELPSGATGAGAAYVAVRAANGKWARQAYLKASAAATQDGFGEAVALDGDTIAVAAPGDNSSVGAVYVFVRTGATWSQQAVLTEPTPARGHEFGHAIALEGNRLVVSAIYSSSLSYSGGAVYAFTRTGNTWKADAKHPNPAAGEFRTYDWFGHRLSLSGERLAVSQRQGQRAVFVMLKGASAWTLEDKLELPSDALASSNVALDADTLAVTAPGVVHVYTRSGASWTKQVSLNAFHNDASAGFGSSIALRGDLLVVGSGCDSCPGGVSTFVRDGTTWKNGAFVTSASLDATDAVGFSVALSGTRLAVGAPQEDSNATSFNQNSANNSAVDSGAAFIFE
jgi:hypothetical protein